MEVWRRFQMGHQEMQAAWSRKDESKQTRIYIYLINQSYVV